jgi:hypothetical protein
VQGDICIALLKMAGNVLRAWSNNAQPGDDIVGRESVVLHHPQADKCPCSPGEQICSLFSKDEIEGNTKRNGVKQDILGGHGEAE